MEGKKRRTFIEAKKVPEMTREEQEVLKEIEEEAVCRTSCFRVRMHEEEANHVYAIEC